ncbi:hypothetical protein VHEMI00078 [[Torrubiella] hemipterigena]|uniref:Zn(2)-C6 fungal-type domain-containing protein n=1 Tax=[Torrubiella] hemipterigena TaxID=1531966 RepID=A0A0A1SI94_9HYPO|nr:hypothetical protein VHEMI00078 [[Torrubiella] hemipterigena]
MEYSYSAPAKPHMYKAASAADHRHRRSTPSQHHDYFAHLQQQYHASHDLLYSLWPSVEPNYEAFFSPPDFMSPVITVAPEELMPAAPPPQPAVAAPAQPTRAYVCAICGNKYQRNTHLRRHEATHSNVNKFKCQYCDKEFSRGDVCRKHSLNCPKKDSPLQPPEHRRGRKPTACEACFHSKVLCDKKMPCSRCAIRNVPCRPRDVPEHSFSASSSEAASSSSPLPPDLPFLRGIMDPTKHSMLEYFHTSKEEAVNEEVPESDCNLQPHHAKKTIQSQQQQQQQQQPHDMPSFDDIMGIFPSNYSSMLDDAYHSFVPDDDFDIMSISDKSPVPILTDSGFELLEARSMTLVQDLHAIHTQLYNTDPTYDLDFDVAAAESVLCAENMRSFIATFFRLSHVHFPIVHYPTFGTQETIKSLLLIIVVAGAYRSPPLDDALDCQSYLRLAEEYVFNELEQAVQTSDIHQPSPEVLQTLQAGIIANYLLCLSNNIPGRKRTHTERLPKMVAAVRHFGLCNMRHVPGVDWEKFIYNETCIRVATWAAAADWHHSCLFYHPAVTSVTEMKGNFPCHRELWDAPDRTSYILHKERLDSKPGLQTLQLTHSMSDFVRCIMNDQWSLVDDLHPDALTIETLYYVSVCLSGMAIAASQMMVLPASATALRRACARWQKMWDIVVAKLDRKTLLKAGMARHSCENIQLMLIIIDASLTGRDNVFLGTIAHHTLENLHTFLLREINRTPDSSKSPP